MAKAPPFAGGFESYAGIKGMHEKPQLFALTPRAVMCAANHVLLGAPFYNNFEKLHARCSVEAASP